MNREQGALRNNPPRAELILHAEGEERHEFLAEVAREASDFHSTFWSFAMFLWFFIRVS